MIPEKKRDVKTERQLLCLLFSQQQVIFEGIREEAKREEEDG